MLPIDKTYLKTNLNNWKTLILDPAYIIQKATLPTATAQNLGVIYQYIGSASGLTKGGFYECQVVAGSDPAEYAWVEISTKTLTDNDTIQTNLQKQIYVPDATSSQKGVIKIGHGLETDNVSGQTGVVGFLEEIDELPTATSSNEGKIYLLTDVQTGYDRGGIYMCEESTETAGTYEWKLISMSPLTAGAGITIADEKINADTNIFNGSIQDFEALPSAEQSQYSHIADEDSASATDAYSLTEVKTGKVWIDGKPIYRRVVNKTGRAEGATWSNTGVDTSGMDTIVTCTILTNGVASSGFYVRVTSDVLYLYATASAAWTYDTFIFEYTKTTD